MVEVVDPVELAQHVVRGCVDGKVRFTGMLGGWTGLNVRNKFSEAQRTIPADPVSSIDSGLLELETNNKIPAYHEQAEKAFFQILFTTTGKVCCWKHELKINYEFGKFCRSEFAVKSDKSEIKHNRHHFEGDMAYMYSGFLVGSTSRAIVFFRL